MLRGKGSYAPTGASDKTANAVVETHADGDVFANDPIELVAAGVNPAGTTKALGVDVDGQLAGSGQSLHATYVASVQGLAPTAAGELVVVEAPIGTAVRLKRLVIVNVGMQTTANLVNLQILRTTGASSAGTLITPPPLDPADPVFGGVVRSLPTIGTEATVLYNIPVWIPAALGPMDPIIIDWDGLREVKAPVIPAGATVSGIALKHPGSAGAASFAAYLEFVV
jgi:hypothetical protein